MAVVSVGVLVGGCTSSRPDTAVPPSTTTTESTTTTGKDAPSARVSAPEAVEVAGGTTAAEVASAVSVGLFDASAVAVVVAGVDEPTMQAAADAAVQLGVPLLLDEPGTTVLADELRRLGASTVLAVGTVSSGLPDRLVDVDVVTATADQASVDAALQKLPPNQRPGPLQGTTVLVRSAPPDGATNGDAGSGAALAASATAEAAGARVLPVASYDPRADAAAVEALSGEPPAGVLAAGPDFGPTELLTGRLAVATEGTQLPGGGQVMFPGRSLVALYGHPGTDALGVLGEQDPAASVVRAQEVAAPYEELYDVPVVPTFEIIATVAAGQVGADGDYSNEADVEDLRPLVDAATEAGMYVVIDLQPGRADLVTQAQRYEQFLVQPNVGLALDSEWSLDPDQVPLEQIGSLSATEINAVTTWLADLTARELLPQKMLALHQFRLDMITEPEQLDRSRDEVTLLLHADGQGAPGEKEETWSAITDAVPEGIELGWKNFYDEDTDMATPAGTVQRTPVPLMVSYQ